MAPASLVRAAAAAGCLAVLLIAAGAVSDYHSKPIPVEARGGLLEYSVIYTDRATNSMSSTFQVRTLRVCLTNFQTPRRRTSAARLHCATAAPLLIAHRLHLK